MDTRMDTLRRHRDALNADIEQLEREEVDEERRKTDKALAIKPNLDMIKEWLLSTSELKDFYEMPDEAKYTHHFSTETVGAGIARGDARGDNICPRPLHGPKPPSHASSPRRARWARWEKLRLAGFAQLDLRSGGRFQTGYWDPQKTLLPSQFMIDFVESTHNMFTIIEKRLDAMEWRLVAMEEKIIRLACYTKSGRYVLGERWCDEAAKIDPQYAAARPKTAPVKGGGVAPGGSSGWNS